MHFHTILQTQKRGVTLKKNYKKKRNTNRFHKNKPQYSPKYEPSQTYRRQGKRAA